MINKFTYYWDGEINCRNFSQLMLYRIFENHSQRSSYYQLYKKFNNIINYFCDILETQNNNFLDNNDL